MEHQQVIPTDVAACRRANWLRPAPVFAALVLISGMVALWWSGWFRQTRPALERARQAEAAGRFEQAQQAYLAHLIALPRDSAGRMEYAVFLKQHHPATALEQFRRIPADSAESLEANRHVAEICLRTHRDAEAERALKLLAVADPHDFAVQLSLAELYFQQRKFSDALSHGERALELQPERSQTYTLVAEIYHGLGRVSEMIDPLLKAVELDPADAAARLNLGFALLWGGRTQKAEELIQKSLTDDPRNVNALRMLAMCRRDEGEHEAALAEVRKALAIAPDDLDSRILEGELLLFARRPEEAYERLQPLYESQRENARFLGVLTRAAAGSGKPHEAEMYQRDLSQRAAKPRSGK